MRARQFWTALRVSSSEHLEHRVKRKERICSLETRFERIPRNRIDNQRWIWALIECTSGPASDPGPCSAAINTKLLFSSPAPYKSRTTTIKWYIGYLYWIQIISRNSWNDISPSKWFLNDQPGTERRVDEFSFPFLFFYFSIDNFNQRLTRYKSGKLYKVLNHWRIIFPLVSLGYR